MHDDDLSDQLKDAKNKIDGNVVNFFTRENCEKTAEDDLQRMERDSALEFLEELIEQVRKGEVQGVAVVMGYTDPYTGVVTMTGNACCATARRYHQLFVGGLEVLKTGMIMEGLYDYDVD